MFAKCAAALGQIKHTDKSINAEIEVINIAADGDDVINKHIPLLALRSLNSFLECMHI